MLSSNQPAFEVSISSHMGPVIQAPARVNLLGEHTDYTGGFVLPMAIPFATKVTMEPSEGGFVFRSGNFPQVRAFEQGTIPAGTGDWSDYAVGVLAELNKLGIYPPAFVLHVEGNVPLGAGLSSSASIEVACCLAMLTWSGATLSQAEVALLCQRAENLYVHSPCGIMDQFVITAARAGHALLLNTRTLDYELVPMNMGGLCDTRIVVFNSGVKHSVATGEYGAIRRQMEAGQAMLRERFGVRDLGDSTLEQLEACRDAMAVESYKRCRHVISENARVHDAKKAMHAGDAAELGRLMVAGHASQRDDLQTSCAEIDDLVKMAIALPGCLGARMTGGGFGGCTVNLVQHQYAESFIQQLTAAYRERWPNRSEAWVCEAVDGAFEANGFRAQSAGGQKV